MRILKQSLLALVLSSPAILSAQTAIKGTVQDSANNTVLAGADVSNITTGESTVSDEKGNFTLEANDGDIIVISFFGYDDQEITFAGQTQLQLRMSKTTENLKEVVVIGYGTAKKEDVTGSVNQLNSEDFNKGSITSAQELMTGKIAGVVVTSAGGAPGDGQNIIIRGNSSLSLNSQPLYVVDGVPLADGVIGGSRNPLDFLNPNDIESMTILKDASATAIYGSRAANGVVLVTTKKGKGQKFTYNYNATTSVYTPSNYVDMMNADQFRTLVNQVGSPTEIARLGNANTNWQKEIYKNAVGFDHNLSAMGNIGGKMPSRFSLSNTNQDGILSGDNINRTTASMSLNPSFFDDHLKIELNARGSYIENKFANRGAIGAALEYDPTQPIYSGAPFFGGYHTWMDGNVKHNLAPTNPVALLNEQDDTSEVRRFVGNAKVDYKLHFLPSVTATVNVGYDISNANGRNVVSQNMPSSSLTWDGSYYRYDNQNYNKLFDAYLTFNKDFGLHNLNVVAGYGYQYFNTYSHTYDSELFEQGLDYEFIDRDHFTLLSYFGRFNYNYDNRYILTGTLRADASSKFIKDNQWGYFPSVALAWNISNEDFLKGSSTVNDLKLRAGFGQVGNVNGLGSFLYMTRYNVSQSTAYYQFGSTFYQTYRPSTVSKDLKWEIAETINLGIDYSLFKNKVYGSVDLYQKKTKDLIANVYIDPFTNFGNMMNKNIGDMENKGIEFNINADLVKSNDIDFTLGYNIAFNDNKITNLSNDNYVGGIDGGTGNNIQIHREGYAPYSFYVYKQIYDVNGKPIEGAYEDLNGDGIINDKDRYIHKNPYADVTMGFNLFFRYKNLDLSASARANLGNYAYNNVASAKGYSRKATGNGQNYLSNVHTDFYNAGFVEITDSNLMSDYYVQDASFFRIDNITVGYNLNQAIKGLDVRLYGAVQNVAVFTNYDGLDPEMFGGIDNNFYPRPRTFVFGLNVKF
ncbi:MULTISPECIES: TonB-dependent receptor [unclassified Empedobacter]|uniref:SusC/RagA family TonB-linked outer membrane protein n=1 Tax=unclassified Empedobacter TaxID=2643773 RepID=UPI00244D7BF0|nr:MULTISPECIES: TonB-dependent receptor [unclassified Empedobacter]MDH0659882.1 TonB-dependent receptor [Empedobacter sp. GD03865]MDH0673255.1 TonB-dependent receptor [Empedobacter sp. GD03861]